MVTQQVTLKWLGTWVALLFLSLFAAEGVHFANPDVSVDPSAMQVTLALCFSWLAILLMPGNSGFRSRNGVVILWAAMASAGFLVLSVSPVYFEPGNRSFQLAGAVFVLVLLFSSMHSLIRAYCSNRATAMILFVLIVGILFAAPLYLGVVAEATSDRALIVNSIIAVSPVSYVAGIVDYDYLHSTWFYKNTPFGGLRFSYPAPGIMTVCYLIATFLLMGANLLKNRLYIRKQSQ